jgi:hypothetical protein
MSLGRKPWTEGPDRNLQEIPLQAFGRSDLQEIPARLRLVPPSSPGFGKVRRPPAVLRMRPPRRAMDDFFLLEAGSSSPNGCGTCDRHEKRLRHQGSPSRQRGLLPSIHYQCSAVSPSASTASLCQPWRLSAGTFWQCQRLPIITKDFDGRRL